MNLSKFAKDLRATIIKRSPEILTGIGIAGMITTTVLAVKATPKAIQILEKEKDAREYDREHGIPESIVSEKISMIDTVKLCWKCYIPASVTGVISVGCLIGASSVNSRRNAALAAAYTLSDSVLREYREKVVETIGEKKEQVVRDKMAKEKMEKDPIHNHEVIMTKRGDTLCYDYNFGRYFKSDIETIKRAMNEINRNIVTGMYASLNDFYNEIDLSPIKIGDELGWNVDDGEIKVEFSSQLSENGTPCLVITYNVMPKYNYDRL